MRRDLGERIASPAIADMTATIDLNAIDVPQLEALVGQFYGAGTQEQVRMLRATRSTEGPPLHFMLPGSTSYSCTMHRDCCIQQ